MDEVSFLLPYMSIHLHLRVTLRAEFDLVVTCIAYDLLLLGVVVDRKQVPICGNKIAE